LDELVTKALTLFQKLYGPYRRSSFHSIQHMLRNVVSYVTGVPTRVTPTPDKPRWVNLRRQDKNYI